MDRGGDVCEGWHPPKRVVANDVPITSPSVVCRRPDGRRGDDLEERPVWLPWQRHVQDPELDTSRQALEWNPCPVGNQRPDVPYIGLHLTRCGGNALDIDVTPDDGGLELVNNASTRKTLCDGDVNAGHIECDGGGDGRLALPHRELSVALHDPRVDVGGEVFEEPLPPMAYNGGEVRRVNDTPPITDKRAPHIPTPGVCYGGTSPGCSRRRVPLTTRDAPRPRPHNGD